MTVATNTSLARTALGTLLGASLGLALAPAGALGASGFGRLSGSGGCLVAPGQIEGGLNSGCGEGKALVEPNAIAISPEGNNLYVASGTSGSTVASSFGSVAILKREPATGAMSEIGCLSSDGTDGRDGASGACTATPSLLGADGVAVSPDGSTVFVASDESASVVAFSRNPATGLLTRVGCFQYHPYPGSGCAAANVFPGSAALATSADGKALYIASPTLGSISTLTGALVTPPDVPVGSASSSEASVASIFGLPEPAFLANPCVAVNGYDGTCSVGVATQGLHSLALAPGGEQLYAVAPGSDAVDVFAHSANGMLSETGCLKPAAPPGLCTSSKLVQSPTQIAISPDGKNLYVGDEVENRGRVDVLSRNPSTGALSESSCVEQKPPAPEKSEGNQEEEETHEAAPAPSGCTQVPGLQGVDAIAVTDDGSAVYAISRGSAVVFSRDQSSGALSEVSCAAENESSCASFSTLNGIEGGAVVSPDGHNVYLAASKGDEVLAFGVGLTVAPSASASRAGIARVTVECPRGLRRRCTGRLEFSRALVGRHAHRRRARVRRVAVGGSRGFTLAPGARATIAVRLSPAARRALLQRRRLRLIATVRAQPSAGGAYGRLVKVRLTR